MLIKKEKEGSAAMVLLFGIAARRGPCVLSPASFTCQCFPLVCEVPSEFPSSLDKHPHKKKMSQNGHQVLISPTPKNSRVGQGKQEGWSGADRWSFCPPVLQETQLLGTMLEAVYDFVSQLPASGVR